MNILIEQNKEIQRELETTKELLQNHYISNNLCKKIKIINDKLLEVTESLVKINVNIKSKKKIDLTRDEKEYLQQEKKSNEIISQLMPALTILTLTNN